MKPGNKNSFNSLSDISIDKKNYKYFSKHFFFSKNVFRKMFFEKHIFRKILIETSFFENIFVETIFFEKQIFKKRWS